MFKHYVLTAVRHFVRYRGVTLINLLCLTLGLACFMLAYALVAFMERADVHHAKAARTFVVTQRTEAAGVASLTVPMTGWGYAPLLRADYPGLEAVVRASRGVETAITSGAMKSFTMVSYADPEYLEVFDFDFIAGDRAALRSPHSAVINEALALKLFGTTQVLGKPLLLNNRETVYISGVTRRQAQPSHMGTNQDSVGIQVFSLLVSIDAWPAAQEATAPTRFQGAGTFTFVVFRPGSTLTLPQLRSDLGRFIERHVPAEQGRATLDLRPVNELGVVAMDFATRREQTGVTMTGMMLGLGLLVLIIACLNYANLASAQATTRLKEIAMRRVVGANYRQIVLQTFLEALVLITVAAGCALALIPLLSNLLSMRMGTQVSGLLFALPSFWAMLAATIVAVAVLASSYPALVAARVRPADALHSGRNPVFKVRALRVLVICQFATASFLFVATRILDAHNDLLLEAAAPQGEDNIVVIANDTRAIGLDLRVLQDRLAAQPGIGGVSAIDLAPGELFGGNTIISSSADAAAARKVVVAPTVDYDFFAALRIPVLAGRVFERSVAGDVSAVGEYGNVVIDRTFARESGWAPQQAIGRQVHVPVSTARNAAVRSRTVVGVVEDHTLYPAKAGSAATLYTLDPQRVRVVLVRIARRDPAIGLRGIDAVWNELAPNVALKRNFMDEQFRSSYSRMSALSDVLNGLAVFALVIAALGLLGVATHAISQRMFEIGMRKALGARTRQIVVLLLKDFSKPILLGNLLAWPLAYGFAQLFDVMYASKPAPSVLPYVASLLVCLVVAWLVVLRKTLGAAGRSPAAVLRNE